MERSHITTRNDTPTTTLHTTLNTPQSLRPRSRMGALLAAALGVSVAAAVSLTGGNTTPVATTGTATPVATVETVSTVDTGPGLFDPTSGIQLDRIATGVSVSAQTPVIDPAAGLINDLAWTTDPASGFALYPTALKMVPTVSGGSTLFDPANGIIVDELPAPAVEPVYDPAAGFAIS